VDGWDRATTMPEVTDANRGSPVEVENEYCEE